MFFREKKILCKLKKGQEKKENVFEKYQTQLGLEKTQTKKLYQFILNCLILVFKGINMFSYFHIFIFPILKIILFFL